MHIRHLIATENFAGVERCVANVATELARRGHLVDVIGGDPRVMSKSIGGAQFMPAHTPRTALRAILSAPHPDIVHAHMTLADATAVLTRPLMGSPVISTLHFAHPRGHSPMTRRVYALLRPFLSRELAISQAVANAVGGEVTVLHEGIPEPRSRPLPGHGNAKTILMMQRLEAEKDTATALHAFARSQLDRSGWRLQILGRGSERTALVGLASRLHITSSTVFSGHVDDVEAPLDDASIFLATTPNEGFGLAVVEAMAHGKVVVATRSGAHRETIGPVSPETLFSPGDADAAAVILARLAADADERRRLGSLARRRYQERFTIEAHVDELINVYHNVLAR